MVQTVAACDVEKKINTYALAISKLATTVELLLLQLLFRKDKRNPNLPRGISDVLAVRRNKSIKMYAQSPPPPPPTAPSHPPTSGFFYFIFFIYIFLLLFYYVMYNMHYSTDTIQHSICGRILMTIQYKYAICTEKKHKTQNITYCGTMGDWGGEV